MQVLARIFTHSKRIETECNKPNTTRHPMKNISINIPDIYDENIQKLIKMKLIPSRSEAVRTALREFLKKEEKNMKLLKIE